jgi:DNA polymerase (family 10)
MKLQEAEDYAARVCRAIEPFCQRFEVVGSIRRRRPDVNDVDIVAVPRLKTAEGTPFGSEGFAWAQIPKILGKRLNAAIVRKGDELICITLPDGTPENVDRGPFSLFGKYQVDIYRSSEETWGVLLLIRTGSKDHNIKLCSRAKAMGLMLSAKQGILKNGEVIASRTEEEIFATLGIPFVKPEDREVPA